MLYYLVLVSDSTQRGSLSVSRVSPLKRYMHQMRSGDETIYHCRAGQLSGCRSSVLEHWCLTASNCPYFYQRQDVLSIVQCMINFSSCLALTNLLSSEGFILSICTAGESCCDSLIVLLRSLNSLFSCTALLLEVPVCSLL